MSLTESLVCSLLRSMLIAGMALWPVSILLQFINDSRTARSFQARLLVVICPFFVPELLTGYHYRLTATQLSSGASPVVAAICTELLYGLLQLSRCVAVGVAVGVLQPRGLVTAESFYSWRLLRPHLSAREWRHGWLRLKIFGPWRVKIVTWSLMSLILFQEFETAALMQIDRHPVAWTVWLFDAHAARQPLMDSLIMSAPAMLSAMLLLLPLLVLRMGSPRTDVSGSTSASDRFSAGFSAGLSGEVRKGGPCGVVQRRRRWLTVLICLSPGLLLIFIWPLFSSLRGASAGVVALFRNGVLLQQAIAQIMTSLGFSIAASVAAMSLGSVLCRPDQAFGSLLSRPGLFLLALCGLCGSLVLSLSVLAVFQLPVLNILYDSWLPLLTGHTLAVLPRAVAIVILLEQLTDSASRHSADLLLASGSRRQRMRAAWVRWRLTTARWLTGGFVVAHWCFWDVTVSSVLRPVHMEPVVTRLYNEMHYGRTEALMSLSLLAAAAPVIGFLFAAAVTLLKSILIRHPTAEFTTDY